MKTDKIHTLKIQGDNPRNISFVMKRNKRLIKSKGLLMPVNLFLKRYDYLSALFPKSVYNPLDTLRAISTDYVVLNVISFRKTLLHYINYGTMVRNSYHIKEPIFDDINSNYSNIYIFIDSKTLKTMNNGYFKHNYYSLDELKHYTSLQIEYHKKMIKHQEKILKENSKYLV